MSITDLAIDPVTGLPLLNPNTPIQQIPLGADVFPFADLKASAQPARGPIYGDDIIPTSSLLSGQHPTLGSAQTVQTDGSHAAKVYVVNPSGGGGGPASDFLPFKVAGTFGSGVLSNPSSVIQFTTGAKLYKLRWAVSLPANQGVGNLSLNVGFSLHNGNDYLDRIDIGSDIVYINQTLPDYVGQASGEMSFNPMWDLVPLFGSPMPSKEIDLYTILSGAGGISLNGLTWMYWYDG